MKCKLCKINEEKNKKRNMCASCMAKDWRKNNPEKVKIYAHKRYLRDKEKISRYNLEWQKNNYERYRASIRANRKRDTTKESLRKKTIHLFKELRDNGVCETCGGIKKLEFHHPEPYKYDIFKILCRKCHLDLHRKEYERELELLEKSAGLSS